MPETAEQPEHRPWYKPHITTLAALLAVGAALTYSQCDPRFRFSFGGGWSTTSLYSQGWPLNCHHYSVDETYSYNPVNNQVNGTITEVTNSRWVPVGLIVNIVACLLLLVSTGLVIESWRRQKSRWQFSLRSLLNCITIAGCMLMLYRIESSIYQQMAIYLDDFDYVLHGDLQHSPWYVIAPMVLGIACLLYLLCNLMLVGIGIAFRKMASLRSSTVRRIT